MNISQDFLAIMSKIEKGNINDSNLRKQVIQQIEKLQEKHDEFVLAAKKSGVDLNNYKIGAIEIKFYTLIKALSEKLGLSTEKYDNAIKEIEIRTFGQDGYEQFFKK